MKVVDRTGQPRTDEEIQEAINAVTEIVIKHPLVLPFFTVHAGTIRDCLKELQLRRQGYIP